MTERVPDIFNLIHKNIHERRRLGVNFGGGGGGSDDSDNVKHNNNDKTRNLFLCFSYFSHSIEDSRIPSVEVVEMIHNRQQTPSIEVST